MHSARYPHNIHFKPEIESWGKKYIYTKKKSKATLQFIIRSDDGGHFTK